MEALVQLDGVTKRYDRGAAAVDEVSLQIGAGEAVAVMGPSGSGPFDRAFPAQHGAHLATAGPGQVISLTQRSVRRREYDMRAGERALGWLRWQPGRRSAGQAEGPPEPASTATPVRTYLAQVG